MSDQPGNRDETTQPPAEESGPADEGYGSLSVEDDEAGTVNPADLAGTAKADDEPVGYQPAASEADESEGTSQP
jgi:hypothetical protein